MIHLVSSLPKEIWGVVEFAYSFSHIPKYSNGQATLWVEWNGRFMCWNGNPNMIHVLVLKVYLLERIVGFLKLKALILIDIRDAHLMRISYSLLYVTKLIELV